MNEFRKAHGVNTKHDNGISLSRTANGVDRIVVTYEALEDCFQLRAEGTTPAERKTDLDNKFLRALEENLDVVNRAADVALRTGSPTEDGMLLVTRGILAETITSRSRR